METIAGQSKEKLFETYLMFRYFVQKVGFSEQKAKRSCFAEKGK
jgi:hypothetical protein